MRERARTPQREQHVNHSAELRRWKTPAQRLLKRRLAMASTFFCFMTAIFGSFAVAFGLALRKVGPHEAALARRGRVTAGRVVGRVDDGDGSEVPVVEFVAGAEPVVYRFVARGALARVRSLPVGATVTLRYLPEAPGVARLDTWSERRHDTLGFALGCAVCAAFSAATLVAAIA